MGYEIEGMLAVASEQRETMRQKESVLEGTHVVEKQLFPRDQGSSA
jgi:hypothetical protein